MKWIIRRKGDCMHTSTGRLGLEWYLCQYLEVNSVYYNSAIAGELNWFRIVAWILRWGESGPLLLYSVSLPPLTVMMSHAHLKNALLNRVHQVKLRTPSEIAHTKWNRTHKTKSVGVRLQAASACLRHCQEEGNLSIAGGGWKLTEIS